MHGEDPLYSYILFSPAPTQGLLHIYQQCPMYSDHFITSCSDVTDSSVMLARKVGPGLQDLQTRGQRILAERNAAKAEENMWIGWMIVTESLEGLEALIKSRGSTN